MDKRTAPASRRRALRIIVGVAGMAGLQPRLFAQPTFPQKNVRLIVPFAPGSGADRTARYIAERLTRQLGQTVIVENKAGADGVIGTMEVMREVPDGHTLLLGSNSTLVLNPLVNKNIGYQPGDFRALTGLGRAPGIFIAGPASPFATLAEFVAECKKRPGEMAVGTYSPAFRLAAHWFSSIAGCKFNHINYKGASQLLTDMAGGQLAGAMVDSTAVISLHEAKKVRGLAVTAPGRVAKLSDVPTSAEAGYPGLVHYSWTGLFAPSKTPEPTLQKLGEALRVITQSSEYSSFMASHGTTPMLLTTAEMGDWMTSEVSRYQMVLNSTSFN